MAARLAPQRNFVTLTALPVTNSNNNNNNHNHSNDSITTNSMNTDPHSSDQHEHQTDAIASQSMTVSLVDSTAQNSFVEQQPLMPTTETIAHTVANIKQSQDDGLIDEHVDIDDDEDAAHDEDDGECEEMFKSEVHGSAGIDGDCGGNVVVMHIDGATMDIIADGEHCVADDNNINDEQQDQIDGVMHEDHLIFEPEKKYILQSGTTADGMPVIDVLPMPLETVETLDEDIDDAEDGEDVDDDDDDNIIDNDIDSKRTITIQLANNVQSNASGASSPSDSLNGSTSQQLTAQVAVVQSAEDLEPHYITVTGKLSK